jgi:hypothetical protein
MWLTALTLMGLTAPPSCPSTHAGHDQVGGGGFADRQNLTLGGCCAACVASAAGSAAPRCDAWVYEDAKLDPGGTSHCWLIQGCTGNSPSTQRTMGFVPTPPTPTPPPTPPTPPTPAPPTPAPTPVFVSVHAASASAFRLSVRFDAPAMGASDRATAAGATAALPSPMIDPAALSAATAAAFTPVTWGEWEGLLSPDGGVALLASRARPGHWELRELRGGANNRTALAGAPPLLRAAGDVRRVEMTVEGTWGASAFRSAGGGPGAASAVGPRGGAPCLGNGVFDAPFYVDDPAFASNSSGSGAFVLAVSPMEALNGSAIDASTLGADARACLPVGLGGLPAAKPSVCASVFAGHDVGGGDRVRDQPSKPLSNAGACCAACQAEPDCTVWIFAPAKSPSANSSSSSSSASAGDDQNCWLMMNVDQLPTPSVDRTCGGLFGAPPHPPGATPSTVWWAAGRAADIYLALPAATAATPPSASAAGTSALYELTGAPLLPPRYALGFHASHWGFLTAADVSSNMSAFRTGDFPADSLVMDYDWFECGTSSDPKTSCTAGAQGADFGFSPETFPRPREQLAQYRAGFGSAGGLGFRFGGIRKPRAMGPASVALARKNGWFLPDTPTDKDNLDFSIGAVRRWWTAGHLHFLNGTGEADGRVDYWWNDEGETTFFTYHRWNMAQGAASDAAAPGQRRWAINRAYTPGLQRLAGAVIWSGDGADCSHAMALRFGRFGAALAACDMRSGDDDASARGAGATALVRQYQNGAYLPIMRVHDLHCPKGPRFPWRWGGAQHAAAFRAALRARYRVLPLLYSLLHRYHRRREPVARPAAWEFPGFQDGAAAGGAAGHQSYMLGPSLLVAELGTIDRLPGQGSGGVNDTFAALPPGLWFELDSAAPGATHQGPLNVSRALRSLAEAPPVMVRAGAVLPLLSLPGGAEAPPLRNAGDVGAELELQVYGGADGAFELVEDDGESLAYVADYAAATRTTAFVWEAKARKLSWTVSGGADAAAIAGGGFETLVPVLFEAGGRADGLRLPAMAIAKAGSAIFPASSAATTV